MTTIHTRNKTSDLKSRSTLAKEVSFATAYEKFRQMHNFQPKNALKLGVEVEYFFQIWKER